MYETTTDTNTVNGADAPAPDALLADLSPADLAECTGGTEVHSISHRHAPATALDPADTTTFALVHVPAGTYWENEDEDAHGHTTRDLYFAVIGDNTGAYAYVTGDRRAALTAHADNMAGVVSNYDVTVQRDYAEQAALDGEERAAAMRRTYADDLEEWRTEVEYAVTAVRAMR